MTRRDLGALFGPPPSGCWVCDPCGDSSRTLVSLRESKCPYCGREYLRAQATREGREQVARDHPEFRERGARSVREFEQQELEGFRGLEAGEHLVEGAESPPLSTDVRAPRRSESTDAVVSWPDPHPLGDELEVLEQAIAAPRSLARARGERDGGEAARGRAAVILEGDALEILPTLPAESIDCACTSPPYYGHRSYSGPSTLGREPTVAEYVDNLSAILRELRRVLKPSGSLWLNLGETYRQKRALLVPQRAAIALADDGWIVRNEIVWERTNVRPESVKDRLTNAIEHVFFLVTKPHGYFFDPAPLREQADWEHWGAQTSPKARARSTGGSWQSEHPDRRRELAASGTRHPRNVWSFACEHRPNNGLAPFPEELPRRCLLAGCPPGGVVIDPFAGTGTTLLVARELGLASIGIDSDPNAVAEMRRRLAEDGEP
jgi:DNA modification methylase